MESQLKYVQLSLFNRMTEKNQCIIVFTKNRPNIVLDTLHQLHKADIPIILIDDSTTKQTKSIINKKFSSKELYYHGRIEQDKFIKNLKKKNLKVNDFVRPLGQNGWNLGYVRNYSLILCSSLQLQKILFVDDDIAVRNVELIYQNMKLLDQNNFVGARIAGMPDSSVVDHILGKLGKKTHKFFSGGFLAFNLESISEFFFNYYNEDWIWLFLHKSNQNVMKHHGTVYQKFYDLSKNIVKRAIEQEFGEILAEGVRQSVKYKDNSILRDIEYWRKIITNRISLMKKISHLSQTNNFKIGVKTSACLLNKINQINEQDFVKSFTYYFNKNQQWNELLWNIKNDYKLTRYIDYPFTH